MKRSNDEIYFEETNRKEIKLTTSATTCQVIITLDQTIGSKLLHHKFKYQTSELQLFLQNVPILGWYPNDIIGTTKFDTIDACIFNNVMRNYIHDFSNLDMVEAMLLLEDDEIMDKSKQKLLIGLLSDELFILQALEEYNKGGNNKNPLEYISNQLKDDERFMLKAIKINGHSIEYLSDRLRNNEEFISIVKQISPKQYSSFGHTGQENEFEDNQSIDDDKENKILETLELVKSDYTLLQFVSVRLKDNEQFILQVVKHNGNALQYASDRLKDNEQIALEVIKNSRGFEYASDRLKDDANFMLKLDKWNYHALEFASDRLIDTEPFILQKVRQNSRALEYASERLKDNENIVLEAVKQDGQAMEWASDRLKDDEQFMLKAVKQNGSALEHASNRLQDDERIVFEAIKENSTALMYASNRLADNEEIVLEAIKHDYNALLFATYRFKDDEPFILQKVRQNGYVLQHASDRLKDNEKIVLEVVQQNGDALQFASDRLRNDFNFANEIFKNCSNLIVFEHFGEKLRNIGFINYYIENYQSHFHEYIRNNIKKPEFHTISSLEMIFKDESTKNLLTSQVDNTL